MPNQVPTRENLRCAITGVFDMVSYNARGADLRRANEPFRTLPLTLEVSHILSHSTTQWDDGAKTRQKVRIVSEYSIPTHSHPSPAIPFCQRYGHFDQVGIWGSFRPPSGSPQPVEHSHAGTQSPPTIRHVEYLAQRGALSRDLLVVLAQYFYSLTSTLSVITTNTLKALSTAITFTISTPAQVRLYSAFLLILVTRPPTIQHYSLSTRCAPELRTSLVL